MKVNGVFVVATIAITLLAADVSSYLAMVHAKDGANRAAFDAEQCRQTAAHIVALQTKPVVAETQEKAFERLTQKIEDAARAESIATNNHLASIAPEPVSRLVGTVYLEKPTIVDIRQATLDQIIGMMCRLALDRSGLQIKSLRLSTPPQHANDNLWNAEITVSYLIYSPLPGPQFDNERF